MWKISTILALAFLLRLIGINWDQGYHLHPDERMLMIVADHMHFFSNLNPNFFNYGSLPLYILKGTGQILDFILSTQYSHYGQMLFLGRFLSMAVDVGTVFLIYKVAELLFKKKEVAMAGAFFYSIAFFPIQNAHFFIVDTFLTFFLTALMYLLLRYATHPTTKKLVFISIAFAAAITTKFTAVLFAPVILGVILLKRKRWVYSSLLFPLLTVLFSVIFMPYAFLDYPKFLSDLLLQLSLNNDPYIFPYTLQYVGTIPYLYYLKNIFFWGLGPILSLLSLYGLYLAGQRIALHKKKLLPLDPHKVPLVIFCIFYIFYFLVIGRSAVKFMRYMLPMYPFFAVLAGLGLTHIHEKTLHRKFASFIATIVVIAVVTWSSFFLVIFTVPHTRIQATAWINAHIPRGATIATEHWDDRLPLLGQENYTFEELPLYELPDDDLKWTGLSDKLKKSDYIILASSRLSTPLPKLEDCTKYKKCYPKTAQYYKLLFEGKLGFKKVAVFTNYPSFKIGSWKLEILDDSADESYTVYDHPKVVIFQKKSQ